MSKVWLITGSSRGLGRALAEAVLASGDQVVATARDIAALDVTDAAAARAAVAFAVERFGRLDVVVNNAGYADAGSFEEMAPEVFDAQMQTNFYGVVNVTRAASMTALSANDAPVSRWHQRQWQQWTMRGALVMR